MPKRSLEDGRRERANAAKAANARERNIAQQYLNAGPSIGNLASAVYHWYNSVPMLGGQNENGNIYITGTPPAVGIKNYANVNRVANVIGELRKSLQSMRVPKGYSVKTPTVRTKVGDVEVDNPGLNYRVGTKEIIKDFKESGVVRAGKINSQNSNKVGGIQLRKKETFENPMFKEGSLWYQPSEEMNGLLVTSEPLVIATKNAQPVANGGIFNIDGKTFVNNFGYRRIPAEGQILDATNTTPYIYDSSYGYRRALDESPIIKDAFRLKQRSGGSIHIAPSKQRTS